MQIKLIRQAPGTFICGQCCVAMALDKPIEEILKIMGDKPTRWFNLFDCFRRFGVNSSPYLNRAYCLEDLYRICIVRVYWNDTNESHWMLRVKENIYDPAHGIGWADRLPFDKRPNTRVTSYGAVYL